MRRVIGHLGNELRLAWYLRRRYWFESVLGVTVLVTMFCALLYALMTVGGKSLASGALDTTIVGFVLWQFAIVSYSSASNDIAEETRQRTVEQLVIVPLPLAGLLAARAAIHLLAGAGVLVAGFLLVGWVADGRLQFSLADVLLPVLLASPSLMGIGYVVAGVLLLAKKLEIAHGLMYFALISLVALPAYPVNPFSLLPYALGAATAKAAAVGVDVPATVHVMIAANSAAYLLAGLVAFSWMERRARRLGLLGHW